MTGYPIALFVHIAAAMALVVGLVLRQPRILGPASLLVLVAGLALAAQGWGFQPWTAFGLVALVSLGAGGSRLPRMQPEATRRTQGALLGLAVGVVWIMATKPGWVETPLALALSTAAGYAVARYALARRERAVV